MNQFEKKRRMAERYANVENNITFTEQTLFKIIEELYRNDINKIDRSYRAKVLFIYDQIPAFLSQHEKCVRLSNIEEKSTFPMYQDTLFWLGDSMIGQAYIIHPKNLMVKKEIVCIPSYMSICL